MIIAVRPGIREVAPGEQKPLVIVSTANGDQIPVVPNVFDSVVGYHMTSNDYRALIGSECYYDKSTVAKDSLFAWNRNASEQQKAEKDLNVTNLVAVITTERAESYLTTHCKPVINAAFDALLSGKEAPLPAGMIEAPEDDDDTPDAEVVESSPLAPAAAPKRGK